MSVEQGIDMEQIISNLIKDSYTYGNKLSVKKLAEVIEYANYKYHNSKEVFSDEIYDILRQLLIKRDPNNFVLQDVGAPVSTDDKVNLPFWMGSMDKIKPDTSALNNYLKKYNGPYNISDKLDGTSGMFHYFKDKNGWKTRLYTRGNGKVGRDISHLIPYLFPEIKKKIPKKEICLRGEIIMSKENFKKYNMKNSRSLTNGVVNSKKSLKIDIVKDTDFVVFDVLEPRLKKSDGLTFAKNLGFKTVFNKNFSSISNESLSNMLTKRRDKSKYEIDGIIIVQDLVQKRITSGNPKYGFAFKMIISDHIMESKILDVEWNASKHGKLTPRVLIEPVIIGGITINYLTGHNAKFVKNYMLGPGAIIKLTLGGGIIPKILETIKPATEPKFPNIDFHWNKTQVEIILDNIDDNNDVLIRRITHFFKKIETKFLGKGLIKRMVDNGFESINDFLNATIEQFLKFDGIKDKQATKLYNSIQISIVNVPLSRVMDASNIFGVGLGEKKFNIILNEYPNILTLEAPDDELIELINNINGFAPTTSSKFITNLPMFKLFIEEHPKIKIQKPGNKRKREDSEDSELGEINALFTGVRDKKLEEYITENGGLVLNSFNKKVTVVIVGDINSNSSKVKKARKNNIPIMTLDSFKDTYNVLI